MEEYNRRDLETPTEFLNKCVDCEHYNLQTCHAGSCQKGHSWPCIACGMLKAGGWDDKNARFLPGPGEMVPCLDYEPMREGNTNRRWLK